jgi:hypothetical protein
VHKADSVALFGRPPIIHLRDCDVTEPLIVDDDYLTSEGVIEQPSEEKSRLNAFVAAIRLHVILEVSFRTSCLCHRVLKLTSKRVYLTPLLNPQHSPLPLSLLEQQPPLLVVLHNMISGKKKIYWMNGRKYCRSIGSMMRRLRGVGIQFGSLKLRDFIVYVYIA